MEKLTNEECEMIDDIMDNTNPNDTSPILYEYIEKLFKSREQSIRADERGKVKRMVRELKFKLPQYGGDTDILFERYNDALDKVLEKVQGKDS